MLNRRVLVVGTTSDYVHVMDRRFPDRAVFVTDVRERARASEPTLDERSELLADLEQPEQVLAALRAHMDRCAIEASGIACFDCESMALASFLARGLGLSYPSAEAVAACRSKYLCKRLWREAGLPCPDVELVHSASDAVSFIRKTGGPAVMKPLTGSGSELVFCCNSENDCVDAFERLTSGLADHRDRRMYAPYRLDGVDVDPRKTFVIEEFIDGDEYICDFAVERGRVRVLRIARKIPHRSEAFGTTLAYVVPAELPWGAGDEGFANQLGAAANSLGVERAICMLDFVVRDGRALMIELAPRPGGDCLPPLLLRSYGLDILGCAMDLAEGRRLDQPKRMPPALLAAVRLFATCSGMIERVDATALRQDRRVVECSANENEHRRIALPPDDSRSRLLGHAIFEPHGIQSIETECIEIASMLRVHMQAMPCATASPS